MFRSPTWGPEGVERRKREPAGTCQARPERGGMVRSRVVVMSAGVRLRSFWYRVVGG
jgi:hypothetical protein